MRAIAEVKLECGCAFFCGGAKDLEKVLLPKNEQGNISIRNHISILCCERNCPAVKVKLLRFIGEKK